MHVLRTSQRWFPPAEEADEDGILAVGGDLSAARLVAAYQRGIFPWYSEGQPILWHCPNPRFVLETSKLHIPRSLKKVLRRRLYQVRFDVAFEEVIDGCASARRVGQRGTWITSEMRTAYVALHRLGLAHSAEAWRGGVLLGGVYGVSLGAVFFGESMFTRAADASKVAFVTLAQWLHRRGVGLIDCQQATQHMLRFGAQPWPRAKFVAQLQRLMRFPTCEGRWALEEEST